MDVPLLPTVPEGKLIEVVSSEGMTSVLINGSMYMLMKKDDEASQRMAIVQLARAGIANHAQLSEAFGVHINSVTHYLARYEREGLQGLCEHPRGPREKWKLQPEIRKRIVQIAVREGAQGCEDIRGRLERWGVKVSRERIREVLEENGLVGQERWGGEEGEQQRELFGEEEAETQGELDFGDASGRRGIAGDSHSISGGEKGYGSVEAQNRGGQCAYSQGQREYLNRLEQGQYNSYAGGLLFAALIARYSFLPIVARIIDVPRHEGYSVEQMCLALLYADLFGYRSIEDYKRAYAEEFGVLIGRASSPSPWSVRRFLHRVRRLGVGEQLIEEFACQYLHSGVAEWGVLYIDGHFMPYYGLYPIMKGWHAVRQKGMKGSYAFMGVDVHFTPWIFLVRSAQEDLLQKIPEIIEKGRQIGRKAGIAEERLEKLVVIFDREGFSGELYRQLDGREAGRKRVLFVSWAKYGDRWVYAIPEEKFAKTVAVEYEFKKGEQIAYFETERMMSRYGKIRTIVIQSGRQKRRAAIYTNSEVKELGSEEVVRFICRRWGEENLIKELIGKHMIDYTPGYVRESLSEQPLVDNPQVQELKHRRAQVAAEGSRLKVALAELMIQGMKENTDEQTMRSRQAAILADIVRAEAQIEEADQKIQRTPAKVPFPEAHGGVTLERMNYEKKRVVDCIKIFGYNIQKQMCSLLLHHYSKRKEVYPALSMIVRRGGYIKLEGGMLRVLLRRFGNREIDYAARHLCQEVNATAPVTADRYRFRLHFGVS